MMRLNGYGYGYGDGDGNGNGYGYGYGYGDGDGDGDGDGNGNGEQPHATRLWVDDNPLSIACQQLLFRYTQCR